MQAKLMSMDELMALVAGVQQTRQNFDASVQKACREAIGQSIVHRNATPANALVESVGSHVRRAVVAQLEKFGNLAYQKDGKSGKMVFFDVAAHGGDKLAWTQEYAEQVEKSHWTKAVKEVEAKSQYDALEAVGAAINTVDKLIKKHGDKVVNIDAFRKVKAAYAAGVASILVKDANIDAVEHTAPTHEFTQGQQRQTVAAASK